jgi:hypothetical protein
MYHANVLPYVQFTSVLFGQSALRTSCCPCPTRAINIAWPRVRSLPEPPVPEFRACSHLGKHLRTAHAVNAALND